MKPSLLIVLILTVLAVSSCDRNTQSSTKDLDDAAKAKWQKAVSVFAEKYGAETNWESRIPKRGSLSSPFSIDVTRALMPTNGHPVLLMMELKDVVEDGNDYLVLFDGYFFKNQDFQLCLEAKCTQGMAEHILKIAKGKMLEFASFAVIAKIENISRVRFEVQGTSGGTPAGDLPELEVLYSPDTFTAKGVCIDVIQREDVLSNL